MFKTVQQTLEAQRRAIRELHARVNELMMMEGQGSATLNRPVASVDPSPFPQWTATPPELAASEEIEEEPLDYLTAYAA